MASSSLPEKLTILGAPLTPIASYAAAVERVAAAIASDRRMFCVAINPEKIYWAQRKPALMAALHQAQMAICDGVGAAWAARLLHGVSVPRCTGVDLFKHLLAAAAQRGWGVYLLGASEESSAGAAAALRAQWPALRIVGRQNGYFDDSTAVVEAINASGAQLLFVAMGSPRQELWITEHRERLAVPLCMGVGGTLDVFSGTARRAPEFWRRVGLEFFYRLVTEPHRAKRQRVLPAFAARVLWERLRMIGGGRRAVADGLDGAPALSSGRDDGRLT